MAQFFNDLFATGATTPITSHTSNSGHAWLLWFAAGGAGVPQVYTAGGGILGCASLVSSYRTSVIAPVPDVSVSGVFHVDSNAGYTNIGVCARLNLAVSAGYLAVYDLASTMWKLYRLGASGAATELASSAVSVLTVNSDPTYEFTVVGTVNPVLTMKINGATVVTYTDVAPGANYLAAGYIGYWCNAGAGGVGIWTASLEGNDVVTGATAITMTGPTTGAVGVASANFTVGANGPIAGTIVVTPSDAANGGTFTPTTVSISAVSPTGTFTYTPASSGAKTISAADNGGLTDPANITYTASAVATAVTMTGPSGGVSGVASTNFTVGANGTIAGTVVVTPSDAAAGGTFTPTTVSISAATPTGTFTYTPASVGAKTISTSDNGGLADPTPITYTVTASGVISGTSLFNAIKFSPYNWEVTGVRAKTWHPGAYFRTIFDGATCSLQFDMTGVGTAPQLTYQVDGTGPWVQVTLAANIVITIPTNVANSTRHYLEVRVKVAGGANCWTTDFGAVMLTSITVTAGGSCRLPVLPSTKNGMFFGDSITNGDLTVQGVANDSADASASWAFQIGKLLNSEFGICAFGSTRWFGLGGGGTGVPGLSESYNFKSNGVARSFTDPVPDYIVINMGTNDPTDVTAPVTTTLNGLIAATPGTTKIIVMRPFNGARASEIVAGIAACSTPARVTYMNTTGFLDAAFVDGSGLHPLAFENVSHIVPQVLPLVVAALNASAALTPRTAAVTLGDAGGALINLTGLRISIHDEVSPQLWTTPRYQTAAGTTDGAAMCSVVFNSTLPVGGTCCMSILTATGQHLIRQVVVS